MIPILFDKNDKDLSGIGIGYLSDATKCIVTEERNGIYELEMVYPISGTLFHSLWDSAIIRAKPSEGAEPQFFRVYKITRPIGGQVTVLANHISYDLGGYPLAGFSAIGANPIGTVEKAFSEAGVPNRFTVWSDITRTGNIAMEAPCSARGLLGGVSGSVLDIFGGEYEFDNFCVKLHASRGADNGVSVHYGKNITALTQTSNISNCYTHFLPYAIRTDDDGTEHYIYLAGEKTVKIAEDETIGRRRCYIIDLTDRFNEGEVIDSEGLAEKAAVYKRNQKLTAPKISLSVSFVPLWQTEEYKSIAALERVRLCDVVGVYYDKLGVSARMKVIKTVYDSLAERYTKIELGDARANMADTLQGKIEEAESGIAGVYQSFIAANGKLRSEISRTYATVDALTGTKALLGSEIEQNADKISLVVESTDTGGDVIRAASIVTAINGGGSEVVISADHVDIDGVLTVGKNSGDILSAGDVTKITKNTVTTDYINSKNITAAAIRVKSSSGADLLSAGGNAVSIAGWNVDSNSLYKYPSGVDDYGSSVFVSTGTHNSYRIGNSGLISGWCFGAGGRFGVTRDGAVYANDIHILPTDSQWSQIGSFYVSGDNFQSFRPPTNPTGVWNMMMSASQLTTMYTAGSTSTAHSSTWVNVALAGAEMENGASDPKVKKDIGGLDSRYDDVFYLLRPCRFRYTFGTSGRYHPGFIATEMQEAVLAAGLSTEEFSPLVHLKAPMDNGSEWLIRMDKLVPLCVDQIQKLNARLRAVEIGKGEDDG